MIYINEFLVNNRNKRMFDNGNEERTIKKDYLALSRGFFSFVLFQQSQAMQNYVKGDVQPIQQVLFQDAFSSPLFTHILIFTVSSDKDRTISKWFGSFEQLSVSKIKYHTCHQNRYQFVDKAIRHRDIQPVNDLSLALNAFSNYIANNVYFLYTQY